jgi:dynein heavy chain
MMIQSLYDQTRHAQENYPEDGTQRDKWLFDYAAQPVLTIDMVQWTAGVTAAIKEIMSGVNAGALNEFLSFSELQLDNMIKLVRGKLDKLQRAALGALIVLDVHAKYVVTDFLIKNRVENINSFDWQQQLRYYWEELLEDDGD